MISTVEEASAVMREAMRETISRHSLLYLVQSALLILAGLLALVYPVFSAYAIARFLGWLLIGNALVQAIGLIDVRTAPQFSLHLVSVGLSLVVGAIMLRNPSESLLSLSLLVAVFFTVEGLSKVIFAFSIRPFPNWGWVLLSGLIGIAMAMIILANLPLKAAWMLGVLVGVGLLSEGLALGQLVWKVRNAPTPASSR